MKNLWWKKFNFLNNSDKKKSVLFWSVLAIIIILMFFSFIYTDILITVKHSLNLIQTMVDGHPMGFYASNYGLVVDKLFTIPTMATYDLPIFIIFAIWNFPLWIVQNLFHVSITESLLCLIWLKSLLVLLLGLCAWVVKKICLEINIDKKYIKWAIFAFVSSPLLLMPLFIMNQYDIIALLFILLGIWMYAKGKFGWFVFWFAIAIPMKMFALFIFIPLILLNNKKILPIIKYIVLGLIPLIATKLISSQMPMYKESTAGFNVDMLSKMFKSSINVDFGNASLFCGCLIAIAIFCYVKKLKDKDELNKFCIYIPFVVLASFFIFVEFNPYWIILITPFIAIMLFQNMKNFKINIILDMISSAAILVVTLFYYYWCYGSRVIERMAIPSLFGSTYGMTMKYANPSVLLAEFGVDKFMPFLLAAYVTCMIAMLIIDYPKKSSLELGKPDVEWGLLFTRMLIIVPIPILMIYCYYAR